MDIERYWHGTVEMTVAELRAALEGLPGDAAVRIDVPARPRPAAMRDRIDLDDDHRVVSAVLVDDADHLMKDEMVLQADFSSEWYVRPRNAGSDPASHPEQAT
ncbi:hypothetical protein LX16_4448 [Stackebrandtia albiflava]|uniref:Uncharacterized protein n=2 Tax=Stackebrandtia albiflava TaxID=406432 RepID=A0A562URH4_9ACTN|nr:hypothetical protein LX16_4448 [Stackebrandtia albiflava]